MEGNWNGAAGNNKYQYNEKELNDDFGLDWLDYGFRYYDAAVGRFWSIDPLAERNAHQSTYTYANNNPICRIDVLGLEGEQPKHDDDGSIWLDEVEVSGKNEQSTKESKSTGEVKSTTGEKGPGDVSNSYASKPSSDSKQNSYSNSGFEQYTVSQVCEQAKEGINNFMSDKYGIAYDFTFKSLSDAIFDYAGGKSWSGTKNLAIFGLNFLDGAGEGAQEAERIWEVGLHSDLKKVGNGLNSHHVGQKAVMKKLVKGYDVEKAPAILVPEYGHVFGKKVLSRITKGFNSVEQLLKRDFRELRRVYPDIPESALEELLELNKKMYPSSFPK